MSTPAGPTRAPLSLLVFLALRGLGQSRTTFGLLVLAVTAGVALQVPNTANLRGYAAELMRQGVSSGLGDVRLYPKRGGLFEDGNAVAREAAMDPAVVEARPILAMAGAVAHKSKTAIAPVLGVNPGGAHEPYSLASGSPLAPGDTAGMLLGAAIARRLDIAEGQAIELRVILARGGEVGAASADLLSDGCSLGLVDCSTTKPPVSLLRLTLTVRGIVTGTFGALDSVFVNRALLADALADSGGEPHAASVIAVYAKDHDGAGALAARLTGRSALSDARTWRDDSPTLRSSIDSISAVARVAHVMAILGVAIPVWALLYVRVLQRRREIGLYGAIGLGPFEVFVAFLLQALVIAIAGAILGALLGMGIVHWFTLYPLFDADGFVIRPVVEPRTLFEPILVLVAATVLAGVVPALRAAQLDAARILRSLS